MSHRPSTRRPGRLAPLALAGAMIVGGLAAPPTQAAPAAAGSAMPADPRAVIPSEERVVGALVRDLTGRPGTEAEMLWWGTLRQNGMNRRALAGAIIRSPQGSRHAAAGIMATALARTPDAGGVEHWAGEIARGNTAKEVASRLYASPEVRAQGGGTSAGHVGVVFQRVLGRSATPADTEYWVERFDSPAGRVVATRALVRTVEAAARRVDDTFRDLLYRSPDPASLTYWAREAARTDDLAVATTIAATSEYAALAAAGQPAPAGSRPWPIATPAAHGMDPAVLDGARTFAFAPGRNTQGVVVVHQGEIVSEWYAPGRDQRSWAASWSVGKSIVSALIGIAIEEGHIASVDAPMTTWFPEWRGTPKAAMTLRHVLAMASGLQWTEDYNPSSVSEIIQMVVVERDQLAYAASRPAEVAPGTRFSYSSGDSMLLSGVLERATGRPLAAYAREKLFDPIGFERAEMWRDATGNALTYCCIDSTSRGYARIGQLYLQGGVWDGRQVVPADWVTLSTSASDTSEGYGLQWWLGSIRGHRMYRATGHDGQFIYVIPDLDLVVVRNGTYDKYPGEPIGAPNLFVRYPSAGLVPGQGTMPAAGWNANSFLGPIIDSLGD